MATSSSINTCAQDYSNINSVKLFECKSTERNAVEELICNNHYSRSTVGVTSKYCFGLYYENTLIGAAILANPATPGVASKYGNSKTTIEIRRFCCIDNTPRNTESYFLSKILKWLRNNTKIKTVLSYADPYYGHNGTIYKAANFKYLGTTKKSTVYYYNGKMYHDKSLRTRYKGKLKPYSKALIKARSNRMLIKETRPAKYIFVFEIT
ncbi:MAG: hypothetical protein GY730_06290 [bacterium]|nr:hypothetical protein [bacterium]